MHIPKKITVSDFLRIIQREISAKLQNIIIWKINTLCG